MQFIVFRAGGEEFGISISTVREIIKTSTVTPLPNSPDFIKGIINVRGEIVTAIDIKAHLSLKERNNDSKHIIVTKLGDCLFGLIVDEVIEIIRIKKGSIQKPSLLMSKNYHEYINGIISHEGRLIVFLELAKIISWQHLTMLQNSYGHL